MKPKVLVLAGYDASGAAGLTRDLWALDRAGMHGIAIPTCLTIQGATDASVTCIDLPWFADALEACLSDDSIRAIKTGLVAHDEVWTAALPRLRQLTARGVPIVVDPVHGPSRGGFEIDPAVRATLLGPVASLGAILTPNLPELAWLAGADEDAAVASLLQSGFEAVVVKGGHRETGEIVDRFVSADEDLRWQRARIGGPARRGTGCTLASFLAAALAEELDTKSAARIAGHRLGQVWSELAVAR